MLSVARYYKKCCFTFYINLNFWIDQDNFRMFRKKNCQNIDFVSWVRYVILLAQVQQMFVF